LNVFLLAILLHKEIKPWFLKIYNYLKGKKIV
jgi:hypothetical protein